MRTKIVKNGNAPGGHECHVYEGTSSLFTRRARNKLLAIVYSNGEWTFEPGTQAELLSQIQMAARTAFHQWKARERIEGAPWLTEGILTQ